jgi:predicted methyltransferase
VKMDIKTLGTIGFAAIMIAAAVPALDNSSRPAADIARDADRKPAEMLSFAKVSAGQTVIDLLPGGGYFTRVLAQDVGKTGKVIAFIPEASAQRFPKAVEGMNALAAELAYSNVQVVVGSLGNIGAASSVDRVWTSQNYHDLRNPRLPADTITIMNKAIFAALKPGGYFIVLDHSAAKGSGLRDVATLHRIDGATVKAEVTAAGFKFAGESKLLANPADDRTKNVMDASLRGKTDQFVYRFMKPKK